MKRPVLRLMLWAGAVGGWLALGACGARAADSSPVAAHDSVQSAGAQIFTRICQGCHMPDARGASGAGRYPNLAGNANLASWQFVASTVLNGRKAMPAFGLPGDRYSGFLKFVMVQLSDAQIADVVNYVRSNFGNHFRGTVTAAQVAALPHPGAAPPR